MLQLTALKKYYGSLLALDIPSAIIPPGIIWLQGRNGSGKTTLLKMIAGLHPFDGEILLLNKLSLNKQRHDYLLQINYAEAEPLYPSFLTAENLVKLYCYTKKGSLAEAKNLLSQLQLTEAWNRPLGTYSSGMLKKLSLVLAFTGNPSLILLDEPLVTIDTGTPALMDTYHACARSYT